MASRHQPPAAPLLDKLLRDLLVVGILLGVLVLLAVAAILAALSEPVAAFAVGAMIVVAVGCTTVIGYGRWGHTRLARWTQLVCVVAGALAVAGVGAIWVVEAVRARSERVALGTPPSDVAQWLVLAALALVALAVLLASLPLGTTRRSAVRLVLGTLAAALLLSATSTVLAVGPDGCGAFAFDSARWQRDVADGGSDASKAMAEALARCDTLDGATRAEVLETLGPPTSRSAPGPSDPPTGPTARVAAEWSWDAGFTRDFVFGHTTVLNVAFDGERAIATSVSDVGD